jgi:hypothetical protein
VESNACALSSASPRFCNNSRGAGGGSNGSGSGSTGTSQCWDNEVVIENGGMIIIPETGWTLTDSSGTVVARRAEESFAVGGTSVETVFLPRGATPEMTDSHGICCQEGNGQIVTLNGDTSRADSMSSAAKNIPGWWYGYG